MTLESGFSTTMSLSVSNRCQSVAKKFLVAASLRRVNPWLINPVEGEEPHALSSN